MVELTRAPATVLAALIADRAASAHEVVAAHLKTNCPESGGGIETDNAV